MMKVFILLLSLITIIQAATTTSTTQTLIWVTGTDSDGNLATTQSPYSQEFTSMYDEVASYSSGSIGLGSLSGSVGGIRTYARTTISAENDGGRLVNYIGATKSLSTTWIMATSVLVGLGVMILA